MTLTTANYMTALTQAVIDQDAEELSKIDKVMGTLIDHARKTNENTGKLRKLVEARIWLLYELGHILNDIAPHGGARSRGGDLENTLAKMGIHWRLSCRARDIAAIHPEDIRTFIDESGPEINVSHLLRLHTESTTDPPAWNDDQEWRTVLAVCRDYYEQGENEWRLGKVALLLEDE